MWKQEYGHVCIPHIQTVHCPFTWIHFDTCCLRFHVIGATGILINIGSQIPCPVTRWKMHQFVPGPPETLQHWDYPRREENKHIWTFLVSERKHVHAWYLDLNISNITKKWGTRYSTPVCLIWCWCLTECIASFTWHVYILWQRGKACKGHSAINLLPSVFTLFATVQCRTINILTVFKGQFGVYTPNSVPMVFIVSSR